MLMNMLQTVYSCFTVLCQLRSIHRDVSKSVITSLVVTFVLTRLDYGSATVAGIPGI